MKSISLPVLTGLAHGVSDAVAGFLVVRVLMLNSIPPVDYILLYNTLAFGLQPVVGMIIDTLNIPRRATAVGLFLSATSLILAWFSLIWGILFAGLGSAIFHAGGGSLALTSTPGRAAGPGIFAAFGVIGLALGSQLAFYFSVTAIAIFFLVLLILAAAVCFFPASSNLVSKPAPIPVGTDIEWLAFGLVLAVALRSLVWSGIQPNMAGYSQLALFIALAAGFGKLAGGFLADHIGWRTFTLAAMLMCILLLTVRNESLWLLLAGIILLQSVTPLSLAALGRLMPSSPALASSLVLGVGVLLGSLPLIFLGDGWLNVSISIPMLLLLSGGLYLFTLRGFPKFPENTQTIDPLRRS